MKKIIAILLLTVICLLSFVSCNVDEPMPEMPKAIGELIYCGKDHTGIYQKMNNKYFDMFFCIPGAPFAIDYLPPTDFELFDQQTRDNPNGFIIQITGSGTTFQTVDPDSTVVPTIDPRCQIPCTVDYIYYSGSNVDLSVGQVINIKQRFYIFPGDYYVRLLITDEKVFRNGYSYIIYGTVYESEEGELTYSAMRYGICELFKRPESFYERCGLIYPSGTNVLKEDILKKYPSVEPYVQDKTTN